MQYKFIMQYMCKIMHRRAEGAIAGERTYAIQCKNRNSYEAEGGEEGRWSDEAWCPIMFAHTTDMERNKEHQNDVPDIILDIFTVTDFI